MWKIVSRAVTKAVCTNGENYKWIFTNVRQQSLHTSEFYFRFGLKTHFSALRPDHVNQSQYLRNWFCLGLTPTHTGKSCSGPTFRGWRTPWNMAVGPVGGWQAHSVIGRLGGGRTFGWETVGWEKLRVGWSAMRVKDSRGGGNDIRDTDGESKR